MANERASGNSTEHQVIIVHVGYPTESFAARVIDNLRFAHRGIDARHRADGVRSPNQS